MSTLTDAINTADEALDILEARLSESATGWTVTRFSGTSYTRLFEFIPQVQLPGVLVVYQGTAFNREPGRPQRAYHDVTLLFLAADADMESGAEAARAQVWEALDLLDDYESGELLCRCMDIAAVDMSDTGVAPNVACYSLTLELGDH